MRPAPRPGAAASSGSSASSRGGGARAARQAHPLLAALAEGVALAVAHLDVDGAVAQLARARRRPAGPILAAATNYHWSARRDRPLKEGARLQLVERDARNRLAAAEDVASVLNLAVCAAAAARWRHQTETGSSVGIDVACAAGFLHTVCLRSSSSFFQVLAVNDFVESCTVLRSSPRLPFAAPRIRPLLFRSWASARSHLLRLSPEGAAGRSVTATAWPFSRRGAGSRRRVRQRPVSLAIGDAVPTRPSAWTTRARAQRGGEEERSFKKKASWREDEGVRPGRAESTALRPPRPSAVVGPPSRLLPLDIPWALALLPFLLRRGWRSLRRLEAALVRGGAADHARSSPAAAVGGRSPPPSRTPRAAPPCRRWKSSQRAGWAPRRTRHLLLASEAAAVDGREGRGRERQSPRPPPGLNVVVAAVPASRVAAERLRSSPGRLHLRERRRGGRHAPRGRVRRRPPRSPARRAVRARAGEHAEAARRRPRGCMGEARWCTRSRRSASEAWPRPTRGR